MSGVGRLDTWLGRRTWRCGVLVGSFAPPLFFLLTFWLTTEILIGIAGSNDSTLNSEIALIGAIFVTVSVLTIIWIAYRRSLAKWVYITRTIKEWKAIDEEELKNLQSYIDYWFYKERPKN